MKSATQFSVAMTTRCHGYSVAMHDSPEHPFPATDDISNYGLSYQRLHFLKFSFVLNTFSFKEQETFKF